MFVDSDDYLPPNAIEYLVHEATAHGADIIEGGVMRVYDSWGLLRKERKRKTHQVIRQPELFDTYFMSFFGVGQSILRVAVLGKLFRKSLFNHPDIRPTGLRMGEDLIMCMKIFPYAACYVVTPAIVYCYRFGGMTSSYIPSAYADWKSAYFMKMDAISRFHYDKAVLTTKQEIAGELCSHLSRMLHHGRETEARTLLKEEVDSGFVDEITRDVEFSPGTPARLLKEGRYEELLLLCRKQQRKRFLLLKFMRWLTPILRYI